VNTHAPTVDTGSPARLFAALVAIMLVFAGLFPDGARSLIPAPANSELIYDLGTRTKAVLPKFESGEQLHAQNDDLDGDLPRPILPRRLMLLFMRPPHVRFLTKRKRIPSSHREPLPKTSPSETRAALRRVDRDFGCPRETRRLPQMPPLKR
jgi:hypothetical protein